MQMYKVSFRQHTSDAIDTGDVLVCAASADAAIDMVMHHLGLVPSDTVVEVVRVKPSVYELFRKEVLKAGPSVPDLHRDAAVLCEVSINAVVSAYSDENAIRRVANALIENAAVRGRHMPRHIQEISAVVDRKDYRPSPSRVEEQAIYKERRLFSGGAARPR